ncbi:class I SAM-dependent rRNA methyltransferase [bacterium]|nr:class I SAM-dependent rRNA methyltransferase [bacterium]
MSPLTLELAPDANFRTVRIRSHVRAPFLFRKRIDWMDPAAEPGEIVAVVDAENQTVGYGIFNPLAEIVVRMLTYDQTIPDAAFWQSRFEGAASLRRDLLKLDADTNSYRLIHAEGDGLSGLMVDRFQDVLSIETFSLGMYRRGTAIAEALSTIMGTKHWLVQPSPRAAEQEGLSAEPIMSAECPKQVEIREFGTRFRVRFEDGHKTGFFCDQRDNRKQFASFCEGKRVLDLCCYTGGFAVQAKKLGNAADVTAVDLDEKAVALAKENANLNQSRLNVVHADAFAYMRDMLRLGKRYEVVVLDPPKLINSRLEIEEGKRTHYDLNRLAMQLVEPGGVLLTCSCAGLLQPEEFTDLVLAASRHTLPADGDMNSRQGRRVQILDKSSASADHPIADNCPETEYLKAVWLRVL